MQTVEFEFDLGQRVEHPLTGFTGTIMGQVRYYSGCLQYLVRPPMTDEDRKNNKWPEGHWLDEPELENVRETQAHISQGESIGGGPQDHPPVN